MSRHFDILHRAASQTGSIPITTAAAERANGNGETRVRHTSGGHDEIAKLVQRVFVLPPPDEGPKAVVFCGIDRGAGCTWVCARAAELLAGQVAGRVCVVDANLRSPSLHEYFQVEAGAGFADAMSQVAPVKDFVRSTWTPHLWLMTAGTVGPEPNGALNPARLRTRFSELRNEFDFLLIDTPATSLFAETVMLGKLSDGVVLVVASNSTRRESARAAKQCLDDANVPMLGAVLNKRTFPIPEAFYRRL
jgi:protein-tyrosine kinase